MLAAHENALIAALKARPGLQNSLRKVDSIPNVAFKELLKTYQADAPAVYVAAPLLIANNGDHQLRFTLVVMVANKASRQDARHGNAVAVGIDQLFTLVCRTVHGKRIGETTWSVTRAQYADDELFVQHGLTALEIAIESGTVELPYEDAPDLPLDDLKTVQLDMDIAPHALSGEYGKWLQVPPDYTSDRPDAQATVSLPGGSA